jgi:phage head maturation protease
MQTRATVVLNRAEARELAELVDAVGLRANFALLKEALRGVLG